MAATINLRNAVTHDVSRLVSRGTRVVPSVEKRGEPLVGKGEKERGTDGVVRQKEVGSNATTSVERDGFLTCIYNSLYKL